MMEYSTGFVFSKSSDFKFFDDCDLYFERIYRSYNKNKKYLGFGWTHNFEQEISIVENGKNKTIKYIDWENRVVNFEYSDTNDAVENYESESLEVLKTQTDFIVKDRTRKLKLVFKSDKKIDCKSFWLKYLEDDHGNCLELIYENKKLSVIGNNLDEKIFFEYDGKGNLVKVLRQSRENTTVLSRYLYDENGNLVAHYDKNNNEKKYYYNNHMIIKETLQNGYSMNYYYDQFERCIRMYDNCDQEHLDLMYEYNFANQQNITVINNSAKNVIHLTFDKNGTLRRYKDLYSFLNMDFKNDNDKWTINLEDKFNKYQLIFNERKNNLKLYDLKKNILMYEISYNNDTIMFIDQTGNKRTIKIFENIIYLTTEIDNRVILRYDSQKNLQEIQSNGNRINIDYSIENVVTVNDNYGILAQYEFDQLDRLVAVIDGYQNKWSYVYDEYNNIVSVILPNKDTYVYKYDKLNRLEESFTSFGRLRYSYIHNDKLHLIYNGNRFAKEYLYENNRIKKIIDKSGDSIVFDYDEINRITRLSSSKLGLKLYQYDEKKFILDITDNSIKKQIKYLHNLNNIRVVSSDGSFIEYQFNDLNQLINIANADSNVIFEYDVMDRVKKEIYTDFSIDYRYDSNDNIIELIDSDGLSTNFSYDTRDRCTQIIDCLLNKHEFIYDENTNKITRIVGTHFSESKEFDFRGKLIKQEVFIDKKVFWYRKYEYDFYGNLLTIVDSFTGTIEYTYDNENKIQSVVQNGIKEDIVLLDKDTLIKSRNYIYDYNNRLIKTKLIKKLKYNDFDQLIDITLTNNRTIHFTYDSLSRRTSIAGKEETLFHWWLDYLYSETVDNTTKRYLLLPSNLYDGSYTLLGVIEGQDLFIYVTDHIGTPLFLFDTNGKVVWYAEYEIKGKANNVSEIRRNNIRFMGHYFDEETGLNYNRFRYYEPETGLYITPDPFFIKDVFNPHTFATGNPSTYTDPLGLMSSGGPHAGGQTAAYRVFSGIPQSSRAGILDQFGVPYRNSQIDASHLVSSVLAERPGEIQKLGLSPRGFPANLAYADWNQVTRRGLELDGISRVASSHRGLLTKPSFGKLKDLYMSIIKLESKGISKRMAEEAVDEFFTVLKKMC